MVVYYIIFVNTEWKVLDENKLKEMLTFANAAASVITTRKGALRVMPTRDEIQKTCEM